MLIVEKIKQTKKELEGISTEMAGLEEREELLEENLKTIYFQCRDALVDYLQNNFPVVNTYTFNKKANIVEKAFYDEDNNLGITAKINNLSEGLHIECITDIDQKDFINVCKWDKFYKFKTTPKGTDLRLIVEAISIVPLFFRLVGTSVHQIKSKKYNTKFGRDALELLSEKYNL